MATRVIPSDVRDTASVALVVPPVALPWSVVGALIAARRPENRIAWLFSAIGLGLAVLAAAAAYFAYALYGPLAPLRGGHIAAWLTEWLFVPCVFVGPTFTFFLFPDGRFLTRRWQLLGWTLIGLAVLSVLGVALRPGDLDGFGSLTNPAGIGGQVGSVMEFFDTGLGAVLGPVAFLSAAAAMIRRFRLSRGVERQQLKWIAYVVTTTLVLFACSDFLPAGAASDALFFLGLSGLAMMPVFTGMAILRYRLYEIDEVINRTLVYGGLTICLALAYLGMVLVLQQALSALAGGSDLAVAASTLAVAGIFRPARSRIQRLVDRRFFRHRYDAARTLEGFGSRVRDEVGLEALSDELRATVTSSMQPAHVSLWLRKMP